LEKGAVVGRKAKPTKKTNRPRHQDTKRPSDQARKKARGKFCREGQDSKERKGREGPKGGFSFRAGRSLVTLLLCLSALPESINQIRLVHASLSSS
jgi:hypothetical protein